MQFSAVDSFLSLNSSPNDSRVLQDSSQFKDMPVSKPKTPLSNIIRENVINTSNHSAGRSSVSPASGHNNSTHSVNSDFLRQIGIPDRSAKSALKVSSWLRKRTEDNTTPVFDLLIGSGSPDTGERHDTTASEGASPNTPINIKTDTSTLSSSPAPQSVQPSPLQSQPHRRAHQTQPRVSSPLKPLTDPSPRRALHTPDEAIDDGRRDTMNDSHPPFHQPSPSRPLPSRDARRGEQQVVRDVVVTERSPLRVRSPRDTAAMRSIRARVSRQVRQWLDSSSDESEVAVGEDEREMSGRRHRRRASRVDSVSARRSVSQARSSRTRRPTLSPTESSFVSDLTSSSSAAGVLAATAQREHPIHVTIGSTQYSDSYNQGHAFSSLPLPAFTEAAAEPRQGSAVTPPRAAVMNPFSYSSPSYRQASLAGVRPNTAVTASLPVPASPIATRRPSIPLSPFRAPPVPTPSAGNAAPSPNTSRVGPSSLIDGTTSAIADPAVPGEDDPASATISSSLYSLLRQDQEDYYKQAELRLANRHRELIEIEDRLTKQELQLSHARQLLLRDETELNARSAALDTRESSIAQRWAEVEAAVQDVNERLRAVGAREAKCEMAWRELDDRAHAVGLVESEGFMADAMEQMSLALDTSIPGVAIE